MFYQVYRFASSVRTWPQLTTPGFSEAAPGNGQLDNLLAYLRHMAQRK